MHRFALLVAVVTVSLFHAHAGGEELRGKITVDLTNPGPKFARTMHGIFFEDINYAADGGLYAEMVQNRSFEHREPMYAWRTAAPSDAIEVEVAGDDPINVNNPRFLRVIAKQNGAAIANTGYDGVNVKAGKSYMVSIYARSEEGSATLRIALVDEEGHSLGEAELSDLSGKWQKLEATITPSRDTPNAQLQVQFLGEGVYDVDMVSLFPRETFRGRKNGLRSDLGQLLADMQPGFLRFPGGCIVEGRDLANAYRWKDTIGDVAERKQNWNLWSNPQSPQYHQTYGLGFFEYFQLAEDIGAEPLPVINCGMACQARGGTHAPLEELGPWVQDALDLIEFANGPITSPWGARRAAMGHAEPFNMKYLGIGNEQWSDDYFQRYKVFYDALRAKHPEIKLISTAGPSADGELYDYAWARFATDTRADLVDEHYYRPPSWFLENHVRYDNYLRSGLKVFAGEFAAHTTGRRNNLEAALAEAAFMTGLWRNADAVHMACYAPLFARVGNVQWAPDLIWFDNERSFGSPSYYVQQMYAKHLPERMARATVEAAPSQPRALKGRIGIGTWRTKAEFKEIKVTSNGETLYEWNPADGLEGWDEHNGEWAVVDGVLRQTSGAENVRLFTGDREWSDYSLTLKARKLDGAEGFLISFASTSADTPMWWNLGGWNNTQHGLEMHGATVTQRRGQIERDRWYDVRIDVRGPKVSCYLDGELVQDHEMKPHPSLYAAAGFNAADDEVVLAVANPTGDAVRTAIETEGRELVEEPGFAEVLAGGAPSLENSLDEPRRVAPREETAELDGDKPRFTFEPYSFTILKLKAK